eukprot:4593317-Pyramimonas_sp.AAC.1
MTILGAARSEVPSSRGVSGESTAAPPRECRRVTPARVAVQIRPGGDRVPASLQKRVWSSAESSTS